MPRLSQTLERVRIRLQRQLAYDAARADIESHCPPYSEGPHTYYDTARVHPDDRETVDTALCYLRLSTLLHWHPLSPSHVRLLELKP